MKNDIKQQLSALDNCTTQELKAKYEAMFGVESGLMRRDKLIAEIAYKIQVKHYGGLSKTIKNKLERMAYEDQKSSQPKFKISHGTKLVRLWNGKKHEVTVTDNGFEYSGRQYRSLSNIATEITGSRWSGPLFFGLKKQKVVA